MDRDLEMLTLMLLDPCLTADEAAREAAARVHTASVVNEARTKPAARKVRRQEQTNDPAVGF